METKKATRSARFEAEVGERVLWSGSYQPLLALRRGPLLGTFLSMVSLVLLLLPDIIRHGPRWLRGDVPELIDVLIMAVLLVNLAILAAGAAHIAATEATLTDRRLHITQPGLVQEIRIDETVEVILKGQVLVWHGPVHSELRKANTLTKLLMRREAARQKGELIVAFVSDPKKPFGELKEAGVLPSSRLLSRA